MPLPSVIPVFGGDGGVASWVKRSYGHNDTGYLQEFVLGHFDEGTIFNGTNSLFRRTSVIVIKALTFCKLASISIETIENLSTLNWSALLNNNLALIKNYYQFNNHRVDTVPVYDVIPNFKDDDFHKKWI